MSSIDSSGRTWVFVPTSFRGCGVRPSRRTQEVIVVNGVKKVDHIAIAVKSIAESRSWFESVYGARYLGQKENVELLYIVAYFLMGESLITMLEGTAPESFVTQHIERRGEGIQHMGVEVDDLDAFLANAESLGARVSNQRTIEGIRKEIPRGPPGVSCTR